MMGQSTWTDIPSSPDEWVGDKTRIKSFFNTWKAGTPRAKAILLYGDPGCGKTSSVYAFGTDANIIHINCSSQGNIKEMEKIYELVQMRVDLEGKPSIVLLDEIEGLTHKSLELMEKIIKTTKVPIVLTCNMDIDKIKSIIYKYKWGKNVDVFEVIYPEDKIPYKLQELSNELGIEVKMEILERIASICNSVRSSILTFHQFVDRGQLGKIVPIDIRGSTHEQMRKLLTGKKGDFKIDYGKFLDYCLCNKVPATDVSDFVLLSEMAKRRRLAKIDEKFRDQMRSNNPIIFAPKVKAKTYFWIPKQKKDKREKKVTYKKSSVKVRKKTDVSIDDLWGE